MIVAVIHMNNFGEKTLNLFNQTGSIKPLTWTIKLGFIMLSLFSLSTALAADRTVNFDVGYKTVNFTGKSVRALAINHQIPGPTLHFKEGDTVTINVYNHLNEGTTIHWHGLILPWNMDGVDGVSQEAIPPGGVFHYHFTLKQSGTYWYHAHTGLEEQQGLYGAMVIDPLQPPAYQYDKDYTIVLSDWSNTPADQVLANLKKSGDFYSSKFPLQGSLVQFIQSYRAATPEGKKELLSAYNMMQHTRMGLYDISDVAYNAFLLNGQPNTQGWSAPVKVGDVVRLRLIDAGGSTIFHVKIPGSTMKLVSVDGNDIRPLEWESLDIAPGETYDVLVKIQKDSPYIIYAESADTLGAAYGALITHPNQIVDYAAVNPFPIPQPMMMGHGAMPGMGGMDMSQSMSHPAASPEAQADMPMKDFKSGMANMPNMKMGATAQESSVSEESKTTNELPTMDHDMGDMQMDDASDKASSEHSSHNMDDMDQTSIPMNHGANMPGMSHPLPSTEVTETTPGTKYQDFESPVVTNDLNVPVITIKMVLSGYMDRYIWFINGVPEYKAKPIIIEPGKRYRLIFVNDSMMDHPMHLHGHWMILRNGHGAYDPLVHTLDVPPGATIVADFDADASGQWYFHCHNAFHMMTGMARLFRYSNFDPMDSSGMDNMATHMHTTMTMSSNTKSNQDSIAVPTGHPVHLYQASYFEIGADPFNNVQEATFKSLIGYDDNKLEIYSEDAEINKGTVSNANIDLFYWHLISEFWAVKGGVNYNYRPRETPYWQPGVGVEGLMPFFIDTDARVYEHAGSVKLNLELSRDTQITNKFFIRTGIQANAASKTVEQDEIGSGLNQMQYILRPYYQFTPNLSLYTEFNYTQDYGVQTDIDNSNGEASHRTTFLFGISMLF